MLRTILPIILLVTLCNSLLAQSGRLAGIGNSAISNFDIWSVNHNQAGLADLNSSAVALGYENSYQLNELSTQAAVFALHTKTGNFALNYKRFGYSLYSENNIGIAYARKLGEIISAGIQFDYIYYNQTEDYGNRGVFLMEVGLIAEPIKNFFIGAHFYNPWQAKLADYEDERVASKMRFGLSYYFSDLVLFSIETEKDLEQEIRFKAGIEYEPVADLFLRTGITSQPNEFSLGVGYSFWKFTFDLAFTTHQNLPISTILSLKYNFK